MQLVALCQQGWCERRFQQCKALADALARPTSKREVRVVRVLIRTPEEGEPLGVEAFGILPQRRIATLTPILATIGCTTPTATPGPQVVRYGEDEATPQEGSADGEKDPGCGTHRVTSSVLLCHLSAWKMKPSTMASATAPPPSRMSPLAG
jgi:hypothetical protein